MNAQIVKEIEEHLAKAAENAALIVREMASHPGTSRPGDPPGLHTGDYAKSIESAKIDTLHYRFGTDDPLGVILELGTATMAPRPHFRPGALRLEGS